jgi:hypothetical protein
MRLLRIDAEKEVERGVRSLSRSVGGGPQTARFADFSGFLRTAPIARKFTHPRSAVDHPVHPPPPPTPPTPTPAPPLLNHTACSPCRLHCVLGMVSSSFCALFVVSAMFPCVRRWYEAL